MDVNEILSFQYLVADIKQDSKVRASDELKIQEMVIGLDSAPGPQWIFVPESVSEVFMGCNSVQWADSLTDMSVCRDIEIDLVAIVEGDVNGSWAVVEPV